VVVLFATACGEPEYTGPTVHVHGVVHEYRTVGLRPVTPDIDVCVYDEPSMPCSISDAEGIYALDVPVGETGLVYRGELFVTGVGVLTTVEGQDIELYDSSVLSRTDLKLLTGIAGVTLELGTGILAFEIGQTPGVIAHLDPPAGVGPVYHNNDNLPDPTQIATTYDARGEYANLPPGNYTVTFQRLNTTFTARSPGGGWPRPGGAAFPVVADAITGIGVDVHE
jgi:hypothetical protein